MIMLVKSKDKTRSIISTIVEGLDRIERENVDRAVIYIREIEPKTLPIFVPLDRLRYYDFKDVAISEQETILDQQNYNVIVLVQPKVFGNELYHQRGLEFYERYIINSAFFTKCDQRIKF